MKKTTRWSPDTCDCIIDFEWDTEDPNAQHTTKSIVKACSFHKGMAAAEHHSVVLSENQMKNKAVQIVAKGNIPLDKIAFSFDKDRKLNIVSTDGSLDKIKIQSDLDSKLGSGKASLG